MLSMNNYVPILVAAAVHIGIACLWYSELLFGKMWISAGGCKMDSKDAPMKLGLQTLCSILLATAIMIAINIFQQSQAVSATASGFSRMFSWFLNSTTEGPTMMNAMKVAGFFWMGFAMPTIASAAIWCNHSLNRFFICAAGELVALLAMGASLSYLSNLMA